MDNIMKDFSKMAVLKSADLQAEIESGNFGAQFEGLDGNMYINIKGRNTATGRRQLLKVRIAKDQGDLQVALLKEVNGIEYYSCSAAQSKATCDNMLLAFGFKTASKPAASKPATARNRKPANKA